MRGSCGSAARERTSPPGGPTGAQDWASAARAPGKVAHARAARMGRITCLIRVRRPLAGARGQGLTNKGCSLREFADAAALPEPVTPMVKPMWSDTASVFSLPVLSNRL